MLSAVSHRTVWALLTLPLVASVWRALGGAPRGGITVPVGRVITETVRLSNGVEMPRVAMGSTLRLDTLAPAIETGIRSLGVKHIDTSDNYGTHMDVARAIAPFKRSSYFLTSKVSWAAEAPPSPLAYVPTIGDAFNATLARVRQNLAELGIAYADLILLHWPLSRLDRVHPVVDTVEEDSCAHMREQWRALEAAYEAGLTRAIGVSNFCVSDLECLLSAPHAKVKPHVNQVHFHAGVADRTGLRPFCESRGIVLQGYGGTRGTEHYFEAIWEERYGATHASTTADYEDGQARIDAVTAAIGVAHARSRQQIELRSARPRAVLPA
jgi:diketogulonate reductase-like aldo/keto reductase